MVVRLERWRHAPSISIIIIRDTSASSAIQAWASVLRRSSSARGKAKSEILLHVPILENDGLQLRCKIRDQVIVPITSISGIRSLID